MKIENPTFKFIAADGDIRRVEFSALINGVPVVVVAADPVDILQRVSIAAGEYLTPEELPLFNLEINFLYMQALENTII